ncbi:hypothetical protein AB4Y80_06510 [Specibacter sp. RAF43]
MLGVDLIAALGDGTVRQVPQWAGALGPGPTARGTVRLRIAYEAGSILTAGGFDAAAVQAWWADPLVLASQGADVAPADLMRCESLKVSAKIILAAARSVVGAKKTEPLAWPVRTLVLLDVDGVLVPVDDGRAVDIRRLTALDFFHPPLAAPARFYYDPAVAVAIRQWAAMPGVEVHWLTSWGTAAPGLLAPLLGLPPAPLFAERTAIDVYRNRPWKRFALYDFVGDCVLPHHPTRILWIEDRDARGAGHQLRSCRQPGQLVGSLVIEPASHRGLTESQIAQADAFLARQPTAADAAPLAAGESRTEL